MSSSPTKSLAQKLPYGAGREIERRLADKGGESVRSLGHISRVLSGERDDPIVENIALEMIKSKWKRPRQLGE